MRIETAIRDKLQQGFVFELLDVVNESHQHSVPKDSETHRQGQQQNRHAAATTDPDPR